MTVVFVVVLLIIVVGISMVAAGRGGALPDAEPDAPPLGLPDGPLATADLHAVRFPSALRGYRMRDVDEVLARVGAELDAKDQRIAELEGRQAPGDDAYAPPAPAPPPATPASDAGVETAAAPTPTHATEVEPGPGHG